MVLERAAAVGSVLFVVSLLSANGAPSVLLILLRTCATGVKLLILLGGAGLGVLVATGPGLSGWGDVAVTTVVSAFSVSAGGTAFFAGGGGRGMLGGGGIMRLVGLFTFFILALALGGGMGVLVGVSSLNLPPSSLTLLVGVSFNAAASSNAGGTGGGGRRHGVTRLGAADVLRFGTLPAVGVAGLTALGFGREESASSTPGSPAVGLVAVGWGADNSGPNSGVVLVACSSSSGFSSLGEAAGSSVLGTCGEGSASLGTFWV